jgi:hypothetical protein
MRTASFGGSVPWLMKRRTFEYEARSTSTENVERGATIGERNGFSSIRSYASVLPGSRGCLMPWGCEGARPAILLMAIVGAGDAATAPV